MKEKWSSPNSRQTLIKLNYKKIKQQFLPLFIFTDRLQFNSSQYGIMTRSLFPCVMTHEIFVVHSSSDLIVCLRANLDWLNSIFFIIYNYWWDSKTDSLNFLVFYDSLVKQFLRVLLLIWFLRLDSIKNLNNKQRFTCSISHYFFFAKFMLNLIAVQ